MPVAGPPLRRNRDFLLLWSGQALSALGARASSVAFPLLALALTGSPAQAGLAGFLGSLPYFLVQLPAGALVDRVNRKRLMIACEVGRALALGSLVVALALDRATIAQVLVVAFVDGTLFVFFGLAETAAVPHVVPREQVGAALSTNEARVRAAGLLGPPLGGFLYGIGRLVPFLADAATYGLSIVTLLAIRADFEDRRPPPGTHILADVREGLAWLLRNAFLRDCALLVAGSNLMFQALVLVLIVLARERGASPGEVGLVLAGFGAGGVAGALVAPVVQRRLPASVVVIGANWVWAALVPLLALAPGVLAIGAVAAAMAFVGPAWNVVIGTYQLLLAPDRLRGRVESVGMLISWGAIPLGSLSGGFLIDAFGARATALAFSGWMLAIALAATASPHVRRAPSLSAAHIPEAS
jgi:MFS family permease